MKKISARNQISGKIIEVKKGQTTAHVRIDVGNGIVITSSITNDAVDDLALAKGDDVVAVIKASDVRSRPPRISETVVYSSSKAPSI